jgi:hypothetical protein
MAAFLPEAGRKASFLRRYKSLAARDEGMARGLAAFLVQVKMNLTG